MAPSALDRSTFCFPDSAQQPTNFGTARHFELFGPAAERGADMLDGYIEAHVHGVIELDTDVEAIVLDPCFGGTAIETAARNLALPIEWHPGRVLSVAQLSSQQHYRGPEPVALGHEIAERGMLDARVVGNAFRSGVHDQQMLKYLWHLIARFGSPRGGTQITVQARR